MWVTKLLKTIQSLFKLVFLTRHNLSFAVAEKTDAVILGNGPSLKLMLEKHHDFLVDKELFAVNYFALSNAYFELQPRHYVMIDFKFYNDNANDIDTLEKRPVLWENIAATRWPIQLYLPFDAQKHTQWKKHIEKNSNIKIRYINVTAIEGFAGFRNWCFSKMLGMPRPHNVVIPSLMIAMRLQFINIYLWGVDHSWLSQIHVDDNNVALVNNQHFYDSGNAKPGKYILKNNPAAPLHTILYSMMTAFESYFIIQSYSQKQGVRIINQTRGSMIDAFEREYLSE